MIRVLGLSVALLSLNALRAHTADYFPLQTGNSWLYRMAAGRAGDEYRSISVTGTESIGDQQYFDVDYFGRLILLRPDADGAIVLYDRQSGTEKPWLSLNQPEGETFATSIDPCSTTGRIMSRDAGMSIPAGDFRDVVQVGFRGNCADAGITQQFYAPRVGLISHEETSIAGPRRWELVYYRAGVRNGTGREVSFTMALDAARYSPGATMGVRLTLRSSAAEPLRLMFPSGQSYELKIYDESGKLVYTWSAGRAFTFIVRDEKFGPGERSYGLTAPLGELPPGRYRAQGYLTTAPVMFTSEASFEISQ